MANDKNHSALFDAIMKTAVDAIIVIDREGIIREANPAIEQHFGYQIQEIIGKSVSLLMPAPFQGAHQQYLSNYFETGQSKIIGSGREVVGKRKDGSTFPMHLAVSEVRIDHQSYFTGVVRNISDLKEAERKLNAVNAELKEHVQQQTNELLRVQDKVVRQEKLVLLGQASGGIAHEIRNPLNVIQTSTYFLKSVQKLTLEKKQEHLDRIDRQVEKIGEVITALTDLACLPEPHHVSCDVSAVLTEAIQNISNSPSVQLDLAVSDQLPKVMIDPSQVSIAFRNIIQNAVEAMPNGGSVAITSEINESKIIIYVIDTGVGIKPEQIAQVMEPFYSTKPRGMGLGLAMARSIIQKNLGKLSASSQHNEGTTFCISLPIA